MKEILFSDKFLTMSRVQQNQKSYFELIWHETTQEMLDEEYRDRVSVYQQLIEETQAYAAYINTQKFLFTIDPQTQDWINQSVFPATVAAGLRRMAILISEDFYGQLSVEQTMTENPELGFTTSFFEDEQKALVWLLA